jgi:hypothetical protein
MAYYNLDEDKLHEMITAAAIKLVSADMVNDFQDTRYQNTNAKKEVIIDMALAAQDAGDLVIACYAEALTRAEEVTAIDDKVQEAALGNDTETDDPPESNTAPPEALQSCELARSSSPTSASSKRSKRT